MGNVYFTFPRGWPGFVLRGPRNDTDSGEYDAVVYQSSSVSEMNRQPCQLCCSSAGDEAKWKETKRFTETLVGF